MQFIYSVEAGESDIEITNETYKHLKAQRKRLGDTLHVRNLNDKFLYMYEITNMQRNCANLSLKSKIVDEKCSFEFSLGWAITQPKTIEKTLPSLNEIGVKRIDFVYSDFSQRNYKLDMQRLQRILISSCEQCGRSELMEFRIFDSVREYLEENPDSYILDFGGQKIQKNEKIKQVLVGCEGGFSQEERELFKNIISFESPLILRSETASIAVSSLITF